MNQVINSESNRDKIRYVFQGKKSILPPVSIRIDLWHKQAESEGNLPPEIRGLSTDEIEDYLGFCRTARYRPLITLDLGSKIYKHTQITEGFMEEYYLEDRTLRRIVRDTEELRRAGMQGHIVEYPLKDKWDCEVFLKALQQAEVLVDTNDFEMFDKATGDKGNPLCILGPSPAHLIMLKWIGYENFYFLQACFPELIDSLILGLEQLYIRDVWPVAQEITAELILHGAHFSESLTPEPVFLRYFLPYFVRFNRKMHNFNKKVLFHSDTDLGNLSPLMLEAGFDGADCLATHPLVRETFNDYLKVWNGRIVCWGGLPSIIFDPHFPISKFRNYVDDLREFSRGKAGIIIGASDNVMPGAEWERLLYITKTFQTKL